MAAFYGGSAFVIVQIIDGTFEVMGIPAWVSRLMITFLALGFPIAMGLAWIFDITPEGIVRTAGSSTRSGRQLTQPITSNRALIAVTIIAVAFGIWGRWGSGRDAGSVMGAGFSNSVAVLPFVNLNNDPEQDFFSDGITDNILTYLHKFGDLKVIGRTSVMQYKGTTKRLNTIGEELGVKTLVEGSVQRAGDRIIITAQLIDARTEAHLWAEKYDRHIEDIFDIQNEVALAIAQALKVTLAPGKTSAAAIHRPTENLAAYEAYLRGMEADRMFESRQNLARAIGHYEEATRLDPSFADAWAGLTINHLAFRWAGYDPGDERLAKAEWALERAERLAPNSAATRMARGRYFYHGHLDYARALQEFYPALLEEPNNPKLIEYIGYIERRLGNFDRALEHQLRAFELNPKSTSTAANIAITYWALGDLKGMQEYAQAMVDISPQVAAGYYFLFRTKYAETGDVSVARAVLDRALAGVPELDLLPLYASLDNIEGRHTAARAKQRRRLDLLPPGDPTIIDVYSEIGQTHWFEGDLDSARFYFRNIMPDLINRADAERASFLREHLMTLAMHEAALAMADSARLHADQAVAQFSVAMDAFDGPMLMLRQAWVYHTLGYAEEAFAILDAALSAGLNGLKWELLNALWAQLRQDSRYPALAAKYGLEE